MRILQVIPTLDSGGAESFVVELTIALNKLGYQCDVLTLYDVESSNFFKKKLTERGISVSSLGKRHGFDTRMYKRVNDFINKHDYDVIHSHVAAIKYITFASLFNRRRKYFATIHSEARREAGQSVDKWSRRFLFKGKLCQAVTISEESEKSFEDYYDIKAPVIPNGVSNYEPQSPVKLKDNDSQIVFVHVASCQPVKNHILLFEAFKRLKAKKENVKLLWIGNSEMHPDLFVSLSSYVSDLVEYVGVVPNVRDYLAAADALCLSSKMEGMPMSIIEAFSVGCIPICTPVGGIKNMIEDGVNGFLSENLEMNSYLKKLDYFCSLPEEARNKIKENSVKSFDVYSAEKCALKYVDLYQS